MKDIFSHLAKVDPFRDAYNTILAFRLVDVHYRGEFRESIDTTMLQIFSVRIFSPNSQSIEGRFYLLYNNETKRDVNDFALTVSTWFSAGYPNMIFVSDSISSIANALSQILPQFKSITIDFEWDRIGKDRYNIPNPSEPDYSRFLSVEKVKDTHSTAFKMWKDAAYEWLNNEAISQQLNLTREDYNVIQHKYRDLIDNSSDQILIDSMRSDNRNISQFAVSMFDDIEPEMYRECEQKELKAAGVRGEKEVEYVLDWLGDNSLFIEDNTSDRFGYPCIKLKNPDFKDEAQEYDHIAIRENGVFVIETKNYGGKIEISPEGNWIHTNGRGETKGLRNPSQQVYRHEVLLKSFLPKDIPIISVICLSNPKLILEGQTNSKIPVLKSDLITDFIVGKKSKVKLSRKKMKDIKALIESYYSD